MVIYLDEYKAAKPESISMLKKENCKDDIRNSNLKLDVNCRNKDVVQDAKSIELPENPSMSDMDASLGQVYALATQI